MKYQKKVSVGAWLKKGEDFKSGDLVEIANEGKEVEGQYGLQHVFLVKTKDGEEGNVSFNQTTINGLIDAFGDDSLSWVGKKVKALKVVIPGSDARWYFSHPDAELTEAGFVLPANKEEIPIIEEE